MKPIYDSNGVLLTGMALANFLALLQTSNFLIGDFYQFTLNSGAQDWFSGLDVPVTYASNVYKATSLRIEGLKLKLAVGLQVDEQTIKIGALPNETLTGSNFLTSVGAGLLDGAYLLRLRGFWQPNIGIPAVDYLQAPVGVVPLCNMLVSEITKIGRTHVEMVVKSPTKLLDLDMPRNYWSPGCVHTLYDSGCTLAKATFAVSGLVGSGPNSLLIPWQGGVPTPTSADGLPRFAQGRLLFTSGTLVNTQVAIGNNDSNALNLLYPLQQLPQVGDGFTAYPGCSKTKNTCDSKFSNLLNFRGFPFVPQVYISV